MILIGLYLVFVLLIATVVVWLYRKLFAGRDMKRGLVGRADTHTQMTLKAQQGFITLAASERHKFATDPRRSERARDLKVPWGW